MSEDCKINSFDNSCNDNFECEKNDEGSIQEAYEELFMECLELKKIKMSVVIKFKTLEKKRDALREELSKRDIAFEKLM